MRVEQRKQCQTQHPPTIVLYVCLFKAERKTLDVPPAAPVERYRICLQGPLYLPFHSPYVPPNLLILRCSLSKQLLT